MLCLLGDLQLQSSALLEVDTSGGTLTIKETQSRDAGGYTCVAVNAAGTSSGKISLSVGGEGGSFWCFYAEPFNQFYQMGCIVVIVITASDAQC